MFGLRQKRLFIRVELLVKLQEWGGAFSQTLEQLHKRALAVNTQHGEEIRWRGHVETRLCTGSNSTEHGRKSASLDVNLLYACACFSNAGQDRLHSRNPLALPQVDCLQILVDPICSLHLFQRLQHVFTCHVRIVGTEADHEPARW